MSLNGLMGVGLSSGETQNPWDAKSPVAVEFRRPELNEPSAPADYVTLHSGEVQVASGVASADEAGSTFRTVA